MFDMFNMMNKVKEAQEKMKTVQANLVNITTVSESGGGMVKVKANAQKQLLSVDIDPDIMNDKDMVQDLVVAAVNKAMADADVLAKEEIKKAMEGVLPNIPGIDLNAFMR